jgi:hypothetical protein
MSFVVEVIANCGMCGDKLLTSFLSAKALHSILSSSKWQVRIFSSGYSASGLSPVGNVRAKRLEADKAVL